MALVPTRALAPVIALVDGTPTTLSTDVARLFGKRHNDVLRAIETLREQLAEWGVRNFAHTPVTNQQNGETYSAYRLTRNGFALLAMGFTGKKAPAFKIAYIEAFERMETELHAPGPRTVNQMVQQLASQVGEYPLALFAPLIDAVGRKQARLQAHAQARRDDELRANLQAMAAQVDGLANQLKLLAAGANSLCNSSMQAPPPNNRRQGLHTPCVGEIR